MGMLEEKNAKDKLCQEITRHSSREWGNGLGRNVELLKGGKHSSRDECSGSC